MGFRWTTFLPVMAACFAGCPVRAAEAVLTRVVSREAPTFPIATARMAVGRDGNVYLSGPEYVVRVTREGTQKRGFEAGRAVWAATANAAGVIATANAHFTHAVSFRDAELRALGRVDDFFVGDPVEWFAPCDVRAGAGNTFYGIDQNRNRILNLSPPDRVLRSHSIAAAGEDFARRIVRFRVCEALERFYLATDAGKLHALSFDGRLLWSRDTILGGNPWDGYGAAFDVDAEGRTWILARAGDRINILAADGSPEDEVALATEQADPSPYPVTDLAVFEEDILVKRRHPTELFRVYDRATGSERRTVRADVEVVEFRLADDVWTAGETVSAVVAIDAGGRRLRPTWRAWLRPFDAPGFRELPLADNRLRAPADAGGLFHLRMTTGTDASTSDYSLDTWVQIRAPGSRGTLTVMTPGNRVFYGRGEEIPVTVACRAAEPHVPATANLRLLAGPRVIAEETVALPSGGEGRLLLPAALTRRLTPGRYRIRAEATELTATEQPIVVGAGLGERPAFHIVQHGDYALGFDGRQSAWEAVEAVSRHLRRSQALGINLYVDRLGHDGSGALSQLTRNDGLDVTVLNALRRRLEEDPRGVAPAKADVAASQFRVTAAYGAHGIERQAILLYMDAGLPVGTGYDRRTPERMTEDVRAVSERLAPYPAFRGWSWAANWWIGPHGAKAAADPEETARYEAAVRDAEANGTWDPILDTVSDRWLAYAIEAERRFDRALQAVAPGRISAMTGPYRAVTVIPPLTFAEADEIDLHYQAEQIQPPQVTPHNVDFYRRPGKRAWGHPELWNDDGTGDMIFPTVLQMAMRGADGIGWSGSVPPWGATPSDPRATGEGQTSVYRTLGRILGRYGPWLTTLENDDEVVIVVSGRMLRLDDWRGIGGRYFTRLFEAYTACLYAHRPARYVFSDDLPSRALDDARAVLIVSQTVEPEPALRDALEAAMKRGTPVFADRTCRDDLLPPCRSLDMAFDRIENDPHVWQDDAAYSRFPAVFRAHAAKLGASLQPHVAPVAECANPELILTRRRSGEARFVWAVNNTMSGLDPGLAWRTGLILAERLPVVEDLRIPTAGGVIYDVFAGRWLAAEAGARGDFRSLPARLYAVLPRPIAGLRIDAPEALAGGDLFRVRVAVTDDAGVDLPASLPVFIRLVSGDGEPVEERFTATGGPRAEAVLACPLTATGETLAIEAEELVSGARARRTIRIVPKTLPVKPGAFADAEAEPAAPVHASGKAEGVTGGGLDTVESMFGLHFKAISLAPDGRSAFLNAMNRGENLLCIDTETGSVRWRRRIGHHAAFEPTALENGGVAVWGVDLETPQLYHLYVLDKDGVPTRRFPLPGYPNRATSWAAGNRLSADVGGFAVTPDGTRIAGAGTLGTILWDAGGTVLQSTDRSLQSRTAPSILPLNRDAFLLLEGLTATARRWSDGTAIRQHVETGTGRMQGAAANADGRTVAIRTGCDGGRVLILRDGALTNVLHTAADAVALSPDGEELAVTTGRALRLYRTDAGLVWSAEGEDVLRSPRVSPDGRRLTVGDEMGNLYVYDREGALLHRRDAGALPTVCPLPDGGLLVATRIGTVLRLDPDFGERWRTQVACEAEIRPGRIVVHDPTPTATMGDPGNATPEPAPLTPNLLAETDALISAVCIPTAHGDPRPWQGSVERFRDGDPTPPPEPWLAWTDINYIDSGWREKLGILFDTFRTQIRLTGLTFVEDPNHPESWLRDMRLQYRDAVEDVWRDGPMLVSNRAVHTHRLDPPIESDRFRLVAAGEGQWPAGNLRLGEVVFHGETLGASHPDAARKLPVATLFDEPDNTLRSTFVHGHNPGLEIRPMGAEAFSRGHALVLGAGGGGVAGCLYRAPFGHAVPGWDFEIAETPVPGQYRWLQFAWRALSPETEALALLVGNPWPGGGISIQAGTYDWGQGVLAVHEASPSPPRDWQLVRVDLWEVLGRPIRIQSLNLAAVGGPAAFDRILLARSAADLPPPPEGR